MYNANIKEEYLNSITLSSKYILVNVFNKSEIYEEAKGKDICDFVEDEILEFLTGLLSSSTVTLSSCTSLLRCYTQWCCDHNINIDHINHFDMITQSMISNCVNKIINNSKYITLEGLHEVMDNIVNICDKALVLALFYGICGKECVELTNITENDIDMNNHKIHLVTGREVDVPMELCTLLSQSCKIYDYIIPVNQITDHLILDEDDPTNFKRRNNAKYSTQEKAKLRVASRLMRLRTDTGNVSLTIDRLKNSGILYFMNKAIETGKVNKETIYTSDEMKKIQKQYDCEHVQHFTLRSKYKDFL